MERKVDADLYNFGKLLDDPSGRWLLREIITQTGCLGVTGVDGGTVDAYRTGRRDVGMGLVGRIVRKHGWSALDAVMRGDADGG